MSSETDRVGAVPQASADEARPSARPTSLHAWFDPRSNGGHVLYLLFSISIVLSHDILIGGFDPSLRTSWSNGMTTIGGPGLAGFFVLGGFLVARSAQRAHSLPGYVRARALRIFPPLLSALVVTAAVFAPIAWLLQEGTINGFPLGGANGAGRYVLENAGLAARQYAIGYTLEDNPYPYAWNGSLWTIYPQFLCYIAAGFLIRAGRRWMAPLTAVALYVAMAVQRVGLVETPVVPPAVDKVTWANALLMPSHLHLMYLFFLGASLYLYRERVPTNWPVFAFATAGLAAAYVFDACMLVGSTAWGVLAVVLMARVRLRLPRPVQGLSYGVYLTAFPVAQLYALAGVADLGYAAFAVASLASALLLAYVIKRGIEEPVQRYVRRSVPVAPPALPTAST